MADQYTEIISDDKSIADTLRSFIDSRTVCKMEIPQTQYNWVTKLSEIKEVGSSCYLSIDMVTGFEAALSRYPSRGISLEFMERGGVSCQFNTKVVECHSKEILSELPKEIHRTQRRQYARVDASHGMEISFLTGTSTQWEKGKVKNYSAGGVAFYVEKELKLSGGNLLADIQLEIPEGEEWVRFHIPQAVVRHMEPLYGGRTLYAIEFVGISREIRDGLISYISKAQKGVVQKIKR
jgi:c-di-GMP-binding flagellar brake protein YcgR